MTTTLLIEDLEMERRIKQKDGNAKIVVKIDRMIESAKMLKYHDFNNQHENPRTSKVSLAIDLHILGLLDLFRKAIDGYYDDPIDQNV